MSQVGIAGWCVKATYPPVSQLSTAEWTAGFSQWGPLSTLYARHFPSSSRKADYFHLIHRTTPYQRLSTPNHTLTTLDHTRPCSITIYHA